MVFVDELLPSVEEFSADDTGVSCGWVSTLKRRRLALPGEGELKRSAADTPAGGDISTSVITMLISHLHFIGRFPSFSKRRQSLFRVNSRTCRHKIQTSSLLILVFIYCKSETDQKWSLAPSFLDLGPEEASVYPFFAAVAGAGFL